MKNIKAVMIDFDVVNTCVSGAFTLALATRIASSLQHGNELQDKVECVSDSSNMAQPTSSVVSFTSKSKVFSI